MFSLFNTKPAVRVSSSSQPSSLFAAPARSSASTSVFSSLKPRGRPKSLFSSPPAKPAANNLFRAATVVNLSNSYVSQPATGSLFSVAPSKSAETSLSLSSASSSVVSAESPSSLSISRDPRVRAKKSRKSAELLSADSAKALIPSYLHGAVRESTAKSYANQFARYQKFCEKFQLSMNKPESVSAFLVALAETSKGKSSSLSALAGIKFHSKLSSPFKKAPTDNYFVRRIVKSIVKKWSRPVKKAKCLSSLDVLSMVEHLCKLKTFSSDRNGVFFLMQYLLLGRYNDIAHLKIDDLTFLESGDLEVTIRTAKNYDSHDARKSFIAHNSVGRFDPVRVIKAYHGVMAASEAPFLFPNFRLNQDAKVVMLDSPVSYGNMLQALRINLDAIGLKGQDYTLHSVRVGALSELANSDKVDKSVIQRHGRWKTMTMVDSYHKLDLQKKLSVSKALKMYRF